MVAPSGEGAVRCMELALSTVNGDVDYINPHGTSTPVGDTKEAAAIRDVFGAKVPKSVRPSHCPATLWGQRAYMSSFTA